VGTLNVLNLNPPIEIDGSLRSFPIKDQSDVGYRFGTGSRVITGIYRNHPSL
jgi:hypothetical protein